MAAVTVSRSGEQLIAIKQVAAERAGELEREANLLRRLQHPGVVRFIDLVGAPDGGAALHTEFVSSETWATRPLTDPAERAAGVAALAAVVADLHDLGLAHLHITPAHVLHGEHDQPVLCGLARAGEATPQNRLADLAALADLCCEESIAKGPLAGKLSSLADAAASGRIDARELARKLDQHLAKRTPRPERRPPDGAEPPGRTRRVPRRVLYAAATVLLAVTGAVALNGWRGRDRGAAEVVAIDASPAPEEGTPLPGGSAAAGADAASAAEAVTASREVGSTTEAPVVPASSESAQARRAAESEAVTASDDGTPPDRAQADAPPFESVLATSQAPAPVDAAAVLDHGGRRYAVGLEGDLVVTGDWDCDGEAAPAIVRPSTGAVVLFDAWPGPGETLDGPVRWTVKAPTGVEVFHDGSCDLLRVLTASGSRLLDPRRMQ